MSLLNDFGLCTAEEGEMNGLLSSLVLHSLSEGRAVPTMMDLSLADTKSSRIGLWHCGASPTRWLREGTTYQLRKHSILENADPETAVGMMVEFLLATGPVTVLRYQSPDAASAFAFTGNIIDTPMAFRGNYGDLQPTRHTCESIIGTIMSLGLDHHWSVGWGNWSEPLSELHHWLGVQEVAVSSHADLHGRSRH